MIARSPTYRFTVDEYQRLGELGILGEDDRVELIQGELPIMSPIGARHAAVVKKLSRVFHRASAERYIVSTQDPIRLGEISEPQPDLVLLRPVADFYSANHPRP